MSESLPTLFPAQPLLSGRIKSNLRLHGTLDNPVLSISINTPNIVFNIAEQPHRLDDVSLNSSLQWRQTPQGMEDVRLDALKLLASGQSLDLKGKAQRLLLQSAEADFGKGAVFSFLLRGDRNLLGLFLPRFEGLSNSTGDENAIELSGQINTASLPLPPFLPEDGTRLLRQITLSKGRLKVNELRSQHVRIRNILTNIDLKEGRFILSKGSCDFGGPIQFDLQIDYNTIPATAAAHASGLNLNLVECLSAQSLNSNITHGLLSFPWPLSLQSVNATWRGTDLKSLRETLVVEPTGIHIEDLKMLTKVSKPDFYKVFAYDMPESIAREAARRLDEKFAARYASPVNTHYRNIDIHFNVREQCLNLTNCAVGGGNTADLICNGKVWFDGRLDVTIKPVRNIANSFNLAAIMEESVFQGFLRNLDEPQRQKALQLIPQWLEDAAKRGSIVLRFTGTVKQPELDPKSLRDCVRAELPNLIKRIGENFSERDLIKGLLGEDGAKDVDGFLKEFNKR